MSDVFKAFDLSGRVAVVTGAASGIGRASARLLAGAGAAVVCADLLEDAAGATATSIVEAGGTANPVVCDVSDTSAVDALVAGAVERYGRLDVMANVAGIIQTSAVVDTTDDDLDRVLAVNLKGVFAGCRAAARVMTKQGAGSIVNMASGAIDEPAPGIVCYAIAKAGVTMLTRTLAKEVGPQGVRVNAIAPGFVETAMTGRHFTRPDGSIDDDMREATFGPVRKRTPLRIIGEPDDIGYAVLYLASDASRFVTGQILRPNGGVSMPW